MVRDCVGLTRTERVYCRCLPRERFSTKPKQTTNPKIKHDQWGQFRE